MVLYPGSKRQSTSPLSTHESQFLKQTTLEKKGLLFRNVNWYDASSKTRCEIKLEVQMPQFTLRIDIIQHGSLVPLHLVTPQSKTHKLLEKYDYDLKAISEIVQVVNHNKI